MDDPRFEECRALGRSAVADGDYQGGRAAFEEAVQLDPQSVDARYALATVHYLMKEYEAAHREFTRVAELDPTHAGAEVNLGALCNLAGRYEEAIEHLRRSIQLDRGRSEAYYNLGIAYRKLGKWELAIQAYREAHHLNPRMVEAVFNLGNVYFEMARFDQAAMYYRRALDINPAFKKAEDGLARADRKIQETRRPLDSGIISLTTRAGDPIENDSRLDRNVDPTRDFEIVAKLHEQADHTKQSAEEFHQAIEALDSAIRNLAVHLTADAPGHGMAGPLVDYRDRSKLFLEAFARFTANIDALHKIRDDLVERA